jgi:preprotein translocase subunit SecF
MADDDMGGFCACAIVFAVLITACIGCGVAASYGNVNVQFQGTVTSESHDDAGVWRTLERTYDLTINGTLNVTVVVSLSQDEINQQRYWVEEHVYSAYVDWGSGGTPQVMNASDFVIMRDNAVSSKSGYTTAFYVLLAILVTIVVVLIALWMKFRVDDEYI